MMKKVGIVIFVISWICIVVYVTQDMINDYKNQEPHIYHLRDTHDGQYYVYNNFRDEHKFIKSLFHFANEHPGSLYIISNVSDVHFEDGVDFVNESRKNPYFFFSRPDSNSFSYERIRVSFNIENMDFIITVEPENDIKRKKMKAKIEDVNVNIIQTFLDYSSDIDYESRKSNEYFIYELYNRSDSLLLRQIYEDYGRHFTIKMH